MSKFLKWFSGGEYQYMPLTHCLRGDMQTASTLTLCSLIVFLAYIAIGFRWWRDEKTMPHGLASAAMAKLKWIFVISAFASYGFVAVRMFWPAYRLQVILLAPLAYLTWSFVFKGGLRDVYAAMGTVASEHDAFGKMREVLDNLPGLAWTADTDGSVDWYNRQWYSYTGTVFEEMKGWGWQKCHHPDDLPRIMAKWQACLATGTVFEDTFPLRRVDGCFRWFLTRVTPVKNASGKVVKWYGGNTDVDHIYRGKLNAEKLTIDDFISRMIKLAGKA